MDRFQRVQENSSYLKDNISGAIVNCDTSALAAYKAKKLAATSLAGELKQVKQDVSEIKELLQHLLNK